MHGISRLSLILSSLLSVSAAADDVQPAPAAELPGVAVVELFTSEGCSSCPPADRLLSDLAEQAGKQDLPIICIGWHVDYWNRLGWDDRFSSEAISNRQRAYARAFDSNRVYTPQMIVNGAREFTGSDRRQAAESITAAFQQPTTSKIRLNVARGEDVARDEAPTLRVAYEVPGAKGNQRLTVVLVEKGATTDVRRGENSGRTLTHVNAARSFVALPLPQTGAGEVQLRMPDGLSADEALVVALVQDRGTMQVQGAALATIPQ